MEHRVLGRSGFKVPVLCLGTGTFGGGTEFFRVWGATDVAGARRLVDVCLDAGLTMFDTADVYSNGLAEEILGQAIAGRRERVIVSTKATFRVGGGPNDVGSSRHHLLRAVEGALRRLRTEHIDLFQLHGFDAVTPIEETLRTLDDLVRAGKIRYLGCSNFSGWHLMKSLALADQRGWTRYVAHQAYYSLVGRDYEWELLPLGLAEGVSCLAWSPLGFARLTGRLRPGQPPPAGTRLATDTTLHAAPPVPEDRLRRVLDALDETARETGKTVPQIAIAWVLRRPTVASVILGARSEEQLRENLGALEVRLDAAQLARLDAASATPRPYPYWHQAGFAERNPPPV